MKFYEFMIYGYNFLLFSVINCVMERDFYIQGIFQKRKKFGYLCIKVKDKEILN